MSDITLVLNEYDAASLWEVLHEVRRCTDDEFQRFAGRYPVCLVSLSVDQIHQELGDALKKLERSKA